MPYDSVNKIAISCGTFQSSVVVWMYAFLSLFNMIFVWCRRINEACAAAEMQLERAVSDQEIGLTAPHLS